MNWSWFIVGFVIGVPIGVLVARYMVMRQIQRGP